MVCLLHRATINNQHAHFYHKQYDVSFAFDALNWVAGRDSACKKFDCWDTGTGICLWRGVDLHMAQPMPLPPTISCFSKIQIGFTFLVPAHLGSSG